MTSILVGQLSLISVNGLENCIQNNINCWIQPYLVFLCLILSFPGLILAFFGLILALCNLEVFNLIHLIWQIQLQNNSTIYLITQLYNNMNIQLYLSAVWFSIFPQIQMLSSKNVPHIWYLHISLLSSICCLVSFMFGRILLVF